MNNNVITVDLNASPRTISRPLYQYDQGVQLYLKGAGIPALCQVHFSNDRELGTAIPMTCESGFVDVPPQLLRSGRALNFWVCDQTEDEELFTVDAMTIPVVRRPPGVAEAPSAAAAAEAVSEASPFTILEGSVTLTQTIGQPDQWTDIVLPDFDAIEDLPHTADPYEAGYVMCKFYEIPANTEQSSQSRGARAREILARCAPAVSDPEPVSGPDTKPASEFWPPRMICQGMEGPDVLALQAILVARGFTVVTVNGYFDDSTDKAVRRFQEAERLDVDGIAGPKTWARLLARE